MSKPRVVAIGGPTATGKTALSVALAKALGGEIINADSMQVYKKLDVGTAKPSVEERQGIPHHLLDFLTPEAPYSVADFTAAAAPLIETLNAQNRLPFVVGGTGLYITSLLKGVAFEAQSADPAVREQLRREAETTGPAAMHAKLQALDPDYAAKVHPNNQVRVLRALEAIAVTGQKMSDQQKAALPAETPYRSLCLCLTCRDRAVLYRRIDLRVSRMVDAGILQEAEWVWRNRETFRTAAQAIGYKEYFPYFEGTQTQAECTEKLKQATRNYAKRQLTWFRNQNDAVWLYVDEDDVLTKATALVRDFLAK
ncbi:MAG: tRNA (adenosine(37)-N6)-dimethylallyltransferase MiaA [Gemmiger sp.]|uniref:tRNA (adenosine(37)-N6)-dimethylallyltransferase MiaA n=1 Tax=Gemmiger sp. TaxID=2049027 RepID=UPI002A90C920|nr:tRNA (adenosine(37)-N6)-dimethylallyltransferase MiaA [Gemmiger sp.]MDY5502720.1 tRNA (adenosine(37)-N6)-dimethylallyltransferase MiaA [Gemmiger sp.]